MVSGVEGRVVVLEAWVRLGEEFWVVLEVFDALVCSGLKERKNVVFWQR